mmetsp:Transcript_29953/g.21714  ORF Transcript_29953/g.21714 Transcript_29953/m.21714 type:complete len:90 (+) Transcript_29953:294-563(+)
MLLSLFWLLTTQRSTAESVYSHRIILPATLNFHLYPRFILPICVRLTGWRVDGSFTLACGRECLEPRMGRQWKDVRRSEVQSCCGNHQK